MAGQENSIRLLAYIFSQTPIKVATFWSLSSENLTSRPQKELDYLFQIYKLAFESVYELLKELQVNFRWIGDPDGLPTEILQILEETQKIHTYETDKTAVFAINYGGRDEIIRGVQKRAKEDGDYGGLTADRLSSYLDLGDLPPVELVVRTKGDKARRTSGFLSWWIGYAELYFTEKKFPAFSSDELDKALAWFSEVADERNFGA